MAAVYLVPADDDEPERADAGLCSPGADRAEVPGDPVAALLPLGVDSAEFAGEVLE